MAINRCRDRSLGMPPASKLEIGLLGTFSLRLNGNDIRILSRKGCALVGYLALVESHETMRERLLGLLWSDSSEQKARASLRQVLHEVQNTLKSGGFAGFHSDRSTLRLSPESVTIDLLEMLRLAREGHAHPKLFVRQ